jgi:hypothetical protein
LRRNPCQPVCTAAGFRALPVPLAVLVTANPGKTKRKDCDRRAKKWKGIRNTEVLDQPEYSHLRSAGLTHANIDVAKRWTQ